MYHCLMSQVQINLLQRLKCAVYRLEALREFIGWLHTKRIWTSVLYHNHGTVLSTQQNVVITLFILITKVLLWLTLQWQLVNMNPLNKTFLIIRSIFSVPSTNCTWCFNRITWIPEHERELHVKEMLLQLL